MLKLAELFSDGAILQRDKTVRIWGTANAGDVVIASVQGRIAQAVANQDGFWQVELPPLTTSENEILTVSNGKDTITRRNIAVGEVWIAGGQSNMEFPLRYEKHCAQEISTTNPRLRFFDVPEKFYPEQDNDFDYSHVGIWRQATPEDLPYFSAVGYYFQKELSASLDTPVGIIGCNWGGTRSCAWMKEDTVRRVGAPWIRLWEESTAGIDMDAFWSAQRHNPQNNFGNPNSDPFSKFIMPATPTMEEIIHFFEDMMRAAGIAADSETIAENMAAGQTGPEPKNMPGILFRNMVSRTAPYTSRGVIWYQGESDDDPDGLQYLYTDMLKGLIQDWRSAWGDPDFPFIQVQLPGWGSWMALSNHNFTTIRRSQEEVSRSLKNVYMASISDSGEEFDIHPKEKRVVGHRLALLARHYVYGEEVLCDAPKPGSVSREGSQIYVTFCSTGTGLILRDGPIRALRVTQDGQQLEYTAFVKKDMLRISLLSDVPGPVELHFAQDGWYQVNLFNSAGIPAIPFSLTV